MVLSGRVEEDLFFVNQSISDEDLTAQTRDMKERHMVLDEEKSGIGWKFANQGNTTCYRNSRATLIWE